MHVVTDPGMIIDSAVGIILQQALILHMHNQKWLDKFQRPTSLKLLDSHLSPQAITWRLLQMQLEVHLQATFHPKKYVNRE